MNERSRTSLVATISVTAMGLALTLFVGCAGVSETSQPKWINGTSERFPPDHYLLGVGEADRRDEAAERAYEAVARIFTARVTAQAQDQESYLLFEERGEVRHQRRLTIDHLTRVTTDKVLENVQILDRWVDPDGGLHYALAGLHRLQAGSALLERITEHDRIVEAELAAARRTADKLAAIRHHRRAINHLIARDALNADLRVIRRTGQGEPSAYRLSEVSAGLETFITEHVVISVEVDGDQAEAIRRAVIEGLLHEGLPVTHRSLESDEGDPRPVQDSTVAILIKGSVRIWKASLPDPLFSYVRWCSDFVALDLATDRVVGAVSRRGREGHLTTPAAKTRAIKVMQEELSSDVAKSLADHIYGEPDQGGQAVTPPAACQQEETDVATQST